MSHIGTRYSFFRQWVTSEFVRFVVVRGICAIFTYGLYLVLLIKIRYEVAYLVSFVGGVVLAYVINSRYVFREAMNAKSAILFPIVYIVQFLVSFVLLRIAVQWVGILPSIAFAIAVGITIPVTFVLSRLIIRLR
jgi:putative flippase GtrA